MISFIYSQRRKNTLRKDVLDDKWMMLVYKIEFIPASLHIIQCVFYVKTSRMMLSEADIQVAVKASMLDHKLTYVEAHAFMASCAMRDCEKVFRDIKMELRQGMVKVVDTADSLKYGLDVTKIDPMI
jgi:hypothetical protein